MNDQKQILMKRPLWLDFLLIILVPIVGMVIGVGVTFLFGINQTDYSSNLVVNLFFLAACISFIRAYKFSREDLGLKVVPKQMRWHAIISLIIFSLYMLFYIFVMQISSIKPFSANTTWGLLTYLVVVFAEELYYRGMLYGFLEKRFSARIALIVTSILFGLLHGRQGLIGILSKTFMGWLWGSVRYSSAMIFLLIFPIHFAYNVIWLLFDGNWNNPPVWAIYGVPAIEFLFGLAIVILHDRRSAVESRS